MRVKIEVETKTFVRFWLVVLSFAALILLITSAIQAIIILFTALFFAIVLNGPVSKMAKFMPGKSRAAGTAIAYILVVAFLGVFTFLIIPPVIEQSAKVAESIPKFVDNIQAQGDGIYRLAAHYGLEEQVAQAFEKVKEQASDWGVNWAQNVGTNIINSVGSLFGFFAGALLVLVLTFLMLIEAPRWQKIIWGLYHNEDRMKHHRDLVTKMYHVVTGFATGQLAVAGVAAFFSGITVFTLSMFFEVPSNLSLPAAAIVFILTLIPMFGATIAGVIICILLAFNDVGAAIVFAIYFIVYQQIENNFISPVIQARAVELSALAILASVTVGIYLMGVIGGIISIPIAGCIKVLLEDYIEKTKHRRKANSSPLHKLVTKIQEES